MKRITATLAVLLAIPALSPAARDPARALTFRSRIGVESTGWMSFVAFSPDGTRVASEGGIPDFRGDPSAQPLSFWSFPAGRFLRSSAFRPLALSRDWKMLATDDAVVDVDSDRPLFPIPSQFGKAAIATFSPDGKYLAYVPQGRPTMYMMHMVVVSTADGRSVSDFGTRSTGALAIHPDSRTLASGHWDNVTLWNLQTGERKALLRGFGRYVGGIAFSKDGSLLAAGTDTGDLQVWNLRRKRRLLKVNIGIGYVSTPAFSPDGRLVAAGTYIDGTLSLVSVASGKVLAQSRISMFGCGSVAFSPDGKYLIAPSNGGQIGPRRFDTGGTIRVFKVRSGG